MAKRKERRVPCLLYIPGKLPNGEDVPPELMERFLEMLDRQFGGSTRLGTVPGRWLDDNRPVEEPMHRFEVAVKKRDLSTFEKVARLIGKETKQKMMYIVINYQAESLFLLIDDQEESGSSEDARHDEEDDDDEQTPPSQVSSK
jgi:hypothetical protein